MKRDFALLSGRRFDLLVCGGGIYGAWTAYDAALRGLSVAIVEQGDWAHATSCSSSKLIHGGLRYLESFDFKLVKKALAERQMLLAMAPHRVWPLRFGVPIYQDSRTPAEPKLDADQNLAIQLLKVVDAGVGKEWEEKLRAGGIGYGDLKKRLFEVYWEHFAAARTKRAELVANLDYVNKVLADGAAKARAKATEVLKRARKASGLE